MALRSKAGVEIGKNDTDNEQKSRKEPVSTAHGLCRAK